MSKKLFTDYYDNSVWDPLIKSGPGSSIAATISIRKTILKIVQDYQINTIFDCPCGDWTWMQILRPEMSNIQYTGGDIVEKLIENNKKMFQYPNTEFINFDITKDKIEYYDLIICRDLLFHLTFAQALAALQNIKNSNSKYLLITSYTDRTNNIDINTGDWYPINLEIKPFNFPHPLLIVNEQWSACPDRSLFFYQIDELPNL